MFTLTCACGTESTLRVKKKRWGKGTEIEAEGPVQIYIDNDYRIHTIICEACSAELSIEPKEGI